MPTDMTEIERELRNSEVVRRHTKDRGVNVTTRWMAVAEELLAENARLKVESKRNHDQFCAETLVAPTHREGRHLFWANFNWTPIHVPSPPNFIRGYGPSAKQGMMDWLGIHYPENIYYGNNHCPAQILRNCVHPLVGAHILNAARQVQSPELALTA